MNIDYACSNTTYANSGKLYYIPAGVRGYETKHSIIIEVSVIPGAMAPPHPIITDHLP